MTSSWTALVLVAASFLVVGLLRIRGQRSRGFVEIAPCYRSFFRRMGVTEAAHFLALPGERPHVVSGHPDRHVARVTFAVDGKPWVAYLKREHRVTVRWRLASALAGFGFLSRCVREARTLQALQRENVPGPEWMAAGEDGEGRAFLLVREIQGSELRTVLRAETRTMRRRRMARSLGVTLARLHAAGFRHPDLYANHVFVDPTNGAIHVLDWQRARLCRALSWRQRRRDLAALHATVDDALATAEERLLCLRAYWRAGSIQDVMWSAAVSGVEAQARKMLTRRHIREKRQPPAQAQAWICLDGEELCVTPLMYQRCGGSPPNYLLERDADKASLVRRWPTSSGGAALLVRRNARRRRTDDSPEQREAALLLRLQRHGIPAPQVLALGRRRIDADRVESLLLTEPLPDTCSLEAWLSYRTRRRDAADFASQRGLVLRQAGAFVQRLHEASCYLNLSALGCGLAVRQVNGEPSVVIDRGEAVSPFRRRQPRRERRDVQQLQRILRKLGCSRTDVCRFQAGYRQASTQERTVGVNRRMAPELAGFRRPFAAPFALGSLWRRLVRGVQRVGERADWPRLVGVDWADRIMDLKVADRYSAKQGRSSARWISPAAGSRGRLAVYLKRHYELPRWQGWLATLWPRRNWSPALREWQHLEWARRQGLPVPKTVAAAEYVGPWGRLRSFLAVEELTGMLSLQEAIPLAAVRQDAVAFRLWKRSLAVEMARLTRILHDRHCFHKDLYLCHFFIARDDTHAQPADGWRGRVHLIDFHRLGHHRLTRLLWKTKDLAQLLYASEIVGLDARDRLAFWRAYRGEGPHRSRCPWVRRLVLYRRRRYRHHNARNEQRGQAGETRSIRPSANAS